MNIYLSNTNFIQSYSTSIFNKIAVTEKNGFGEARIL